jgi:DUF1009 family protein
MTKLGIIAGGGDLPITIAKAQTDPSEVFIAALDNYSIAEDFKNFQSDSFNIGKVGKILKYFESNGVKNLVIAGAVKRPNLSDLSLDMKGAILMSKILTKKFLGDDALLKILGDYIESEGFTIKSPLEYVDFSNLKATKKQPNKQNLRDIEYGIIAVKKLGELDIGQAVIIENGLVLGVEAAEGTDELIERCADYRKAEDSSVLVKMIKPEQDRRLDVPTIGVETVKNAAKAKMAGIAIEKNQVIILEPENVIETANNLGLFVHVF